MHIRKTAVIVLALVLVMSLAVPVFAATGYGPGTVGGGSSSGGSSGGGSSYTPPSTPSASNPAPATTANVTSAASSAIQSAVASGSEQAKITLTNVSTVPSSALKSAFTQAANAGVENAVIHLDAREGGTILSRVYIDAATAAKLSGTIDFSVSTKGAAVNKAVNTFGKFFDNNIAAISLGQKGAYGTDIKMAAKVDLSKLNTSSLVFYAYDSTTGKYTKLAPAYKIDSNGYLHFSTPVGGDIIISDKPLARK